MSAPGDTRAITIPPRAEWPEPPPRTKAGDLLTDVVMTVLRLNGRIMETAQELAAEGDLTAAWWQVLGGVLDRPRSVAEIGRRMGMSRQGVQRVADLLVDRGLAEYRPNPSHRRAKLLTCTEAGRWAIRQIALVQRPWADRIGAQLSIEKLQQTLTVLRELISVLETDQRPSGRAAAGTVGDPRRSGHRATTDRGPAVQMPA